MRNLREHSCIWNYPIVGYTWYIHWSGWARISRGWTGGSACLLEWDILLRTGRLVFITARSVQVSGTVHRPGCRLFGFEHPRIRHFWFASWGAYQLYW